MTEILGQNMMLIKSAFKNVNSFSLIPLSNNSPYVEVLYDPTSSILVAISKATKETFHMMPRLDDSGLLIPVKNKPGSEQQYKQQRMLINTFNEFYITDKEDIDNFIAIFAINADQFDYKQYMVNIKEHKESKLILPPN